MRRWTARWRGSTLSREGEASVRAGEMKEKLRDPLPVSAEAKNARPLQWRRLAAYSGSLS
jgi:hypothetical protein